MTLRRIVLAGALLLACRGQGLAEVARAATPAEERAAFAALARGGVAFTAYDAAGAQVDLADAQWWTRARTLRLSAGGEAIEHRLIAPENALVLMRE